jgi:hypothetical protein
MEDPMGEAGLGRLFRALQIGDQSGASRRCAVVDTAPHETGVNSVHHLDPVPVHRVHLEVMGVVRAGPIERPWNLPTL